MKFFLNLDFKNILRDEREQSILGEDNDSEGGRWKTIHPPTLYDSKLFIILKYLLSSRSTMIQLHEYCTRTILPLTTYSRTKTSATFHG